MEYIDRISEAVIRYNRGPGSEKPIKVLTAKHQAINALQHHDNY